MRVLLTNVGLAGPGGTESFLLDVARWLRDHGHTPIAYSARLGPFADAIRRDGIVVTDDLARIGERPDVIHGHHHLPTIAALVSHPGVPAIHVCHGWLPWEEAPLRHPAIRRYLAVGGMTRERLMTEAGVPAEDVRIIPNFVDGARFVRRPPLPTRPRRALLFSNSAPSSGGWVNEVRAACEERGIDLDVAGMASGHVLPAPEKTLPDYDLVFARGRSALEAMAMGIAVVLCDVEGVGPLVTVEEFDRLRDGNFGMQVLRDAHDATSIGRQIDRYDPGGAGQVAELVRATLTRDVVVPAIFALYQQAIEDAASRPHSPQDARDAEAAYLRWLDAHPPVPWLEAWQSTRQQLVEANIRASTLGALLDMARADGGRHAAGAADPEPAHGVEMAGLRQENERLRAELAATGTELETLRSGLLVRTLLPFLWGVRQRLLPAGSRQFRAYRRARSAAGRRVRRGPRPSSSAEAPHRAEVATFVPGDHRLSGVVMDVGGQTGLVEAVRSLLSQRPPPEVVVVSSGATGAETRLRQAGLSVDVVHSSNRLMPGATRNVGIAATHEPWVAFLAADCTAAPGWAAGRIAAHAAGARIVSSAVTNRFPRNPFAAAAHCLLFHARLPGTPREVRLHYGASYDRTLFREHGRFRDDLRIGEDTELHARLAPVAVPVFRGDVRVAHRNPTTLTALLRDQAARGRRATQARHDLYGEPLPVARRAVAADAVARVRRSLAITVDATSARDGLILAGSLPWLLPGATAYAIGAATAPVAQAQEPAASPRLRLVCLIAFRDERERLPAFLASIGPHVDAILALDDGSSDGSGELVRGHPKVIELIRVGSRSPHVWDEPRNRRLLIDAAIRHGVEWAMALDADELVERDFRSRAEAEIARGDRDDHLAYWVTVRELWDGMERYRADGVWGRKRAARLFRVRSDHAQTPMALHGHWAPENSRGADGDFASADLIVYHLAMIDADRREERKRKYQRLDPDNRWQSMGYDYLTDDRGLVTEPLPQGRGLA